MGISHLVGEFSPQGILVSSGDVGEPEGQSHDPWSFPSSLRQIWIGGWSALNESVQSRFSDGEAIGKLQTNLIDGCDQIIIFYLPPLVARKQAASCR